MSDQVNRDEGTDSVIAGEYVLRLLTPAEHSAATARIASDGAFAADVAAWEAQLAPLIISADEAAPPALWGRIEAGIAATPRQDNAADAPRTGVRLWQGATALCASVAALFGVMLMNQPVATPRAIPAVAAPLVAALGSEAGTGALTARFEPDRAMLQITPVSMFVQDKGAELWVIPASGKPYSLGLIDPVKPSEMHVSHDMMPMMTKGSMLAVTMEIKESAPHAAPNGPVVASGPIVTL